MKNKKLKCIMAIALGVIIIVGIILIIFNMAIKAVNTCISNGQDANVCNELWKWLNEEIFKDYINVLDFNYPDYEFDTYETELENYYLTTKAYYIQKDGKKILAAQIDIWEEK